VLQRYKYHITVAAALVQQCTG